MVPNSAGHHNVQESTQDPTQPGKNVLQTGQHPSTSFPTRKNKNIIGYYLSKLAAYIQPQSIQNIKTYLPLSDGLFDWDGSA